MIRFTFPDAAAIEAYLAQQAGQRFTYADQGKTAGALPPGYNIDHTRMKIGHGSEDFAAAREALVRWRQFELGWVTTLPRETQIREGEMVAIVGNTLGCYWLNACRIVYVMDDSLGAARFGFAYGTLPDHVGSGEERFLVEMDEQGDVWYDLLAFSRPHGLFGNLGYVYLRRLQKKFGQETAQRMEKMVAESAATPP